MRKIKLKGAYFFPRSEEEYNTSWNKDFSMMVAPKVALEVLVHGHRVEDLVRLFSDPFDFMLRYKSSGGAKIFIGEKEMLKTVRYYISKSGEKMKKIAPPKGKLGAYKRKNSLKDSYYNTILAEIPEGTWDERIHSKNKAKYSAATTSIQSGWLVKECNKASDFKWSDVDYDFYIAEIKKLLIGEQS